MTDDKPVAILRVTESIVQGNRFIYSLRPNHRTVQIFAILPNGGTRYFKTRAEAKKQGIADGEGLGFKVVTNG